MKKSALVLLTLATISYADFTRYPERGVVVDNKTKLVWQDNYDNKEDDSMTYASLEWSDALLYCHNLTLDGGGWKLPNINELKSIIVDKATPTIDEVFKYTKSSKYWSSTTSMSGSNYAWFVDFVNGTTHYYINSSYHTKGNTYYVRCVRAGE